MALKLRIISEHYKQLGSDSSRLFGVTGGRIGRALDNDWVLPDAERYVSSHHAKVSFQAGQWILEDISTNGVFVNDSDTALSVIGPRKLKDGDRLRFGDYDILVTVDDRNDFPSDAAGQMTKPAPTKHKPKGRSAHNSHLDNDLGEELDITGLFQSRRAPEDALVDLDPPVIVSAPVRPAALANTPTPAPAEHALTRFAPEVAARISANEQANAQADSASGKWHMSTRRINKNELPSKNELTSDTSRNPIPKGIDAPRDVAAKNFDTAESQHAFDSFCRGAGIDMSTLNAESQSNIMTLAGQMLREVTLDLMEALKSRPELTSSDAPNSPPNPIKASASVEEVLRRLLQARRMRQLGAIDALRDAFGELRDQRNASDFAALSAVNDLLKRVDPVELQERFDRGLKRTATPQAAYKSKYWDLFVEFFPLVNQRDPHNQPAVYADEFTRKYGEKLTELKQRRRR